MNYDGEQKSLGEKSAFHRADSERSERVHTRLSHGEVSLARVVIRMPTA